MRRVHSSEQLRTSTPPILEPQSTRLNMLKHPTNGSHAPTNDFKQAELSTPTNETVC